MQPWKSPHAALSTPTTPSFTPPATTEPFAYVAPTPGIGVPHGRKGVQTQVTDVGQMGADFHDIWLLGLSAVMLFSQRLFDWGGVLDVKEPDLRTSMTVDCGTAAPDGTVPEVITITYDWTWTSSSPLPDGLDAFVVGWTGDDGEGRPLYLLGVTPDTEPGVYSGRRGHPSRDMTDEAAEESRGWWHWGIELAERGYAPGHVVV